MLPGGSGTEFTVIGRVGVSMPVEVPQRELIADTKTGEDLDFVLWMKLMTVEVLCV